MNTLQPLSINNTKFINNINNRQPNIQNRQSLSTNNISFGSSKSDRAVKLLDKTIDTLVEGSDFNIINKIKFHKILDEALPSIMVPENFLNKGRESKVYRISDRYVAKIKRGHYAGDSIHFYNQTSMPSSKFKQLDFYYGEPIARVGNVEILKNATPNSNHMFCGTKYKGPKYTTSDEVQRYESEFLPACSRVPQESFDALALNLKRLNKITSRSLSLKKETYVPDVINPNNLLISNNRFILVDKLEKVPFENPNSIYTMLEPLMIRLTPEKTATKNEHVKGLREQIFKKALIAAEKCGLPLDSPIKYEYADWTLNDILGKSNILSQVKRMRENRIPVDKRINAIYEFFGHDKPPEPINPRIFSD